MNLNSRQELSWREALNLYRYPVHFRGFSGKQRIEQGWFNFNLVTGNRSETMAFEERFRNYAESRIEVWYEVVFWKMASQRGRANIQTNRVVDAIGKYGISAAELCRRCNDFVSTGTRDAFRPLQNLLFKSSSIAIAFTFPAFRCPDRFPMIDSRVVRYLAAEASALAFPETNEIRRTLKRYREKSAPGVLTLHDWALVEAWVRWCREMAPRLSANPGLVWRARDVEMAVFRAWGDDEERRGWPQNRPRYLLKCE